MEKVEQCILELSREIVECSVYQEYEHYKKMMESEPELRRKLMEFRKRAFLLQNNSGSNNLFEDIEHFEQEYQEFRKNKLVSGYLSAELAVCRLVQHVNQVIAGSIDLELEELGQDCFRRSL